MQCLYLIVVLEEELSFTCVSVVKCLCVALLRSLLTIKSGKCGGDNKDNFSGVPINSMLVWRRHGRIDGRFGCRNGIAEELQ